MLDSIQWLETPEWAERLTPRAPHALPKVRQLYLALYEAITSGELASGQQLPSSRELSKRLPVGRNTVIAAYAQLQDEGLISTDGRRGTRVVHERVSSGQKALPAVDQTSACLSDRSRCAEEGEHDFVDLAPGMPDPELFPQASWRRALAVASRLPGDTLGYRRAPLAQLQTAIARYLAIYRSLSVAPEQIIITSSTRQSLLLAATLYANPGDCAWVESPGYTGAVDAFRIQGLNPVAKRIDRSGMVPEVDPYEAAPSLIYLTPCFQYPTGTPLDAHRRAQLIAFAREQQCMIFEDDYDSEFRDDSQARPALASQQGEGLAVVLHSGTFSKLIFPAVRIAWLVVPEAHVERSHQCLRALGGAHNTVAQAAVAEILNNGSLAKHLQRARGVYASRCRELLEALSATGLFRPVADSRGSLSLVVHLQEPVFRTPLLEQLRREALGVQLLDTYRWECAPAETVTALVVGLGNVSTLKIPEALDRLVRALERCRVT